MGDISLGCDGCNSGYHPTHVSLGLPDKIINSSKEYGGMGINFCCTSCRLERGSDSNGQQSGSIVDGSIVDGSRGFDGDVIEQSVKQLFETVKSLCAAVATLTNDMKQMMKTVGQSNANPINPTETLGQKTLRLAI